MNKDQKILWDKLIEEMGNSNTLFHLHYAKEYTSLYPDDMYGWIVLADVLVSIALYKEAKSALDKSLSLCSSGKEYQVYEQLGHYYSEKYNLKIAEKWYKKAIDHKRRQENLIFMGSCLAKQGRFSEAKEYHKKAVDINPETADEAYYNLGLISRAEGDLNKALFYFDESIKIDSEYTDAINEGALPVC